MEKSLRQGRPLRLPITPKGGINLTTVYFPSWHIASDPRCGVDSLPWDRLDTVHHAFWKVSPRDGGYALESLDPRADTDPANPAAHFPLYEKYLQKYPRVRVLLSVGGWTDSGCFSEMSLTKESRASFIRSCLEVLDRYAFLSGLDLDWEYPGVERRPGGGNGAGNPVRGDDRANYTLLLKELREALDAHFGPGAKALTVCAGASVSGALCKQDYAALHPFVDRVNLMTYDLAGAWDPFTGHQAALFGTVSADTAVQYLRSLGVPPEKIAIGSPWYSRSWRLDAPAENPAGAPAGPAQELPWHALRALEKSAVPRDVPGWHTGYDEKAAAAWLWNDNPASPDYLTFHSWESAASLQAKLDYIRRERLGGLIVWEIHGDSREENWPLLTLAAP